MKKCEGCKYWSELMAQGNIDNTAVEAMCLCLGTARYGKYTILRQNCDFYEEGEPIDL